MAWVTFGGLAWAFAVICIFGLAVNAVGLFWPAASQNPQWRRWQTGLNLGANLALVVWGVLMFSAALRNPPFG
ncbi:MAG: hypothetical protein WDM79_02100 [Terricaulis sp.]